MYSVCLAMMIALRPAIVYVFITFPFVFFLSKHMDSFLFGIDFRYAPNDRHSFIVCFYGLVNIVVVNI